MEPSQDVTALLQAIDQDLSAIAAALFIIMLALVVNAALQYTALRRR